MCAIVFDKAKGRDRKVNRKRAYDSQPSKEFFRKGVSQNSQ